MTTRALLVMLVAGVATLPVPAAAYVRSRTTAGVPTAWKAPCVTMEFSLGAPPFEMDADSYLSAAKQAGDAWTNASFDAGERCSNVIFTVEPVPDVAGQVGRDGHNRLIFRQDAWCRDPPPTDPDEAPCYEPAALAITSVFQLKTTGEIVDADMEVNAFNFTWGDFVGHPEQFVYNTNDFQGAVTHELGHVIGLDHTCFNPGTRPDGTPVPRPQDNNGNPVPDCSPDNPPSIKEATMYVSVDTPSSEVEMRSLSLDDIQGVCDIYPVKPDFVCIPPSASTSGGGGCSCSAQPGGGSIACVVVLLVMATVVRRRR